MPTFSSCHKLECYPLNLFFLVSREDVEKCKQKDLLAEMLAEMTGDFPTLYKVFVSERDQYLARSLRLSAVPIEIHNSDGGENRFCSLLPRKRRLLCCLSEWASEWVSECNNRIQAHDEPFRFRSDIPRSQRLPRKRSFLQIILQNCCLVTSSRPELFNAVFYFVITGAVSYMQSDCQFFYARRLVFRLDQEKNGMNMWSFTLACVLLYFFQYLPESNKPSQINLSVVFQNNSFFRKQNSFVRRWWEGERAVTTFLYVVEAVTASKVWWSLLHHSKNPKWGTVARNLFFLVTALLPWHQNRDSHKLYPWFWSPFQARLTKMNFIGFSKFFEDELEIGQISFIIQDRAQRFSVFRVNSIDSLAFTEHFEHNCTKSRF